MLRKKSNSICYHFMREAVAAKECLASHMPTLKNLSDLLAKVFYVQKLRNLVKIVLFDIYDHDRDDKN